MSLHRWLASSDARTGVQSSYLPHAERGSATQAVKFGARLHTQCSLGYIWEECGNEWKKFFA